MEESQQVADHEACSISRMLVEVGVLVYSQLELIDMQDATTQRIRAAWVPVLDEVMVRHGGRFIQSVARRPYSYTVHGSGHISREDPATYHCEAAVFNPCSEKWSTVPGLDRITVPIRFSTVLS